MARSSECKCNPLYFNYNLLHRYTKNRVSDVVEDKEEVRQSLKQKATQQLKCFGIFGQIKLRKFEYLIVITEAELIG